MTNFRCATHLIYIFVKCDSLALLTLRRNIEYACNECICAKCILYITIQNTIILSNLYHFRKKLCLFQIVNNNCCYHLSFICVVKPLIVF